MDINLEHIKIILKRADLEGLIRIGAPEDEYDSEANTIYNRLKHEHAFDEEHILKIVYFVFLESFGSVFSFDGKFRFKMPQYDIEKFRNVAYEIRQHGIKI